MPAVAIPKRLKLTYSDYALLPADGKRHEIMDGEHYVTPAPNTPHQTIAFNLAHFVGGHIKKNRLGRFFFAPYDLVLSDFDVVQPDLLYFSHARAAGITRANAQQAPDLVIEILSPSTRKLDESAKRKLYERAGVAEYWIVDPELESVKVFRAGVEGFTTPVELSTEEGHALTTPLLPSLAVPLAEIFED
ncbi:MAG: Uma2 family endonuclease [Acidobacteria bacterium]|nr:Uma2 family endonuclease [Acidobacteriota bacterium]